MRKTPASRLAFAAILSFASMLASCIAEIGDIETHRGSTGGVSNVGRSGMTSTSSTASISAGSGGASGSGAGGETTGEGGRTGGAGSGGDNGGTGTSSGTSGSAGSVGSGGNAGGGAGTGGAAGVDAGAIGGSGGNDAGARGGAGGRAGAGGAAGGAVDAGSAPTFRQVSPVVSRHCARCHASWPNYNTLTTRRVNQCGGNVLAKANDAKNSALLQVVQGQCGTLVMPKGCGQTPCIPAADVQLITQWIEAGAPNN